MREPWSKKIVEALLDRAKYAIGTGQTVVLAVAALVMAVALGPRWLRREHAPMVVITARTQAPSR